MVDFCHEFTDDSSENGIIELATVDDVKSRHVGRDDSLTVECLFEFGTRVAMTAAAAEEEMFQEIVVPPPNISWHLERLLESTELGSDVTLVVEEDSGKSSFHAHSLLLSAREPALLKGAEAVVVKKAATGTSKKKQVLWIEGIKAVVLKALLHFVYTGEPPPLDDPVCAATGRVPSATSRTRMAGDLLAAAERFQLVERMRPVCENLLREVMTPEGAAATLELARRHGRPELKAFCLDYMSSSGVLRAVGATEGYKDLSAEALRDMPNHIAAASGF